MNHHPHPSWIQRLIWRINWPRIRNLIFWGLGTGVLIYLGWLAIKTILGITIVQG